VASAQKLFEQLAPLKAEQIVSDLQFEQQRQSLLEQSARLQTLKRQWTGAQAELAQVIDERNRLLAQHQVEKATLGRDLLGLEQEQVQRRSAHVMLLKAPIDGVVSGLIATMGQRVSAGAVMASVVPAGSAMQAVLYVPSTAMGFIKPGQSVRVRYDAFPYQRFGQYVGMVRSVSQTDIPLPSTMQNSPDQRARFLVKVALDKPYVTAYGQQVALRPGHTLTADIELDRRRLIRWMFDPLFAFSGKL
jgi:membrane fusion protein